jgi:hypothetical protein
VENTKIGDLGDYNMVSINPKSYDSWR